MLLQLELLANFFMNKKRSEIKKKR